MALGAVVGQRADRLQQEAAMAEGDAKILKIAIRQLRQHGGRDVILTERLFVPFQPQLP